MSLELNSDSVKQRCENEFISWIRKEYFDRNFGVLAKSELELKIFEFYDRTEGREKSDFSVGKELGLTESRVRNLRQKVYIRLNNENWDWKKEFFEIMSAARYDKNYNTKY